VLAVVVLGFGGLALAQGGPPSPVRRGTIPTDLQPQLKAVGARLVRGGQERVVLHGEFLDEAGVARPATITIEPGFVRLDGVRNDEIPILFDGREAQANGTRLSPRDQAVLDVLALDSTEGMLDLVRNGAGVRLLGRDFKDMAGDITVYSSTDSGNNTWTFEGGESWTGAPAKEVIYLGGRPVAIEHPE
jgi:hypothetical protein